MTIDEIAQKIYEERYQEPAHPEIAEMLRDGMVREIVQRTLELALPSTLRASEDLYEACARAFGTTREDAKKRLLVALYSENKP